MRAPAIGFVIALAVVPGPTLAQTGPPNGTGRPAPGAAGAPPPPGAITREEFIQRRAEAAGRLFDQIDTNHVGYITRAQIRAYIAQRRAAAPPRGGPPPQQ